LRRLRVRALAVTCRIRRARLGRLRWQRGVLNLVICTTPIIAVLMSIGFYHVYFDRSDLPDIEAFARFEFPALALSGS